MESKNYTWIWILVILIILGLGIGLYFYFLNNKSQTNNQITPNHTIDETTQKTWQEGGVAIAGQYADADVVEYESGKFRMYYASEPEAANFNGQIYSATSTDGINWTKEDGIRKASATFPDVIKLQNGTWRMYFQEAGVIKSATSKDGLTWIDEPGTRIDEKGSGFNLDNVGAQSTTILDDETYLMVYKGTINKPYETNEKIPNKDTQLYFYATSKDGLNFEKKGIAIDSRNDTLFGLADGGEWTDFDDEQRVYFWSYPGVYYVTYQNGSFSEPQFVYTNNNDTKAKFAPNPPCDPTLAKINDTWFMYYGQHTKGIYYAEFK